MFRDMNKLIVKQKYYASSWLITETNILRCTVRKLKKIIYTLYLYLQTALHVSGSITTHHQELISLYLQY